LITEIQIISVVDIDRDDNKKINNNDNNDNNENKEVYFFTSPPPDEENFQTNFHQTLRLLDLPDRT